MELNLSFEEQLPQLAVRGLAHGFCLHAHLVLVWRELICTVLLVPQVKEAAGRWADHHQLAVKVLPVQVHILQTPAFNVTIEAACQGWKKIKMFFRWAKKKDILRGNMTSAILLMGKICDYRITIITDVDEIRLVLARHTKPKVSPESRFFPDDLQEKVGQCCFKIPRLPFLELYFFFSRWSDVCD